MRKADPVRTGFITTSRSGLAQCAFNPGRFNAHSVWTQPMRIECAFDVQCGQALKRARARARGLYRARARGLSAHTNMNI